MNILLIARCPPYPAYFGDRLIMYHLTRQLSARGHSIDLVAFYTRPQDLADVARYEDNFQSVQLIPEPRRGRLSYLLRLRKGFFPESAAECWSPAMWEAIAAKLGQTRYDLVHVFGGVQVYEYRHLITGLPNLIVPYESYTLYLRRAMEQQLPGLKRAVTQTELRITRSYERQMFEGYGRVVVLADRDGQMLRKINPQLPISVIPNGVDTEYFSPYQTEPTEPVIAFSGSFDYPPNADAALYLIRRIFPLVQERIPKARLLLIGRDPSAELLALASPSIEVTGRVPDIRLYLEQAMIVVSPLRLGAGIKNKVLEAMALQKPIVATSLSCDGIAVKDGEHLLIADNTRAIASAILRLISDRGLRQRMAQAGRTLVEEHYTWATVADHYEKLYDAVIRSTKRR